ncbi:energy-coupling factor transporter ATPase [[Bacteroides] pectinophilus]|nr:energy-coupling factor transporter ATPase [[Bacteroides] pectinophilus]UWN95351.1 energy-coupling factor transporter ATPase [[Bacteroides] pectinophilus]
MSLKNHEDIIVAENVTFEYYRRDEEGNVEGITTAVDNVSLTMQKGDFIAVLGHNGSGKSTFAKHINALLYPTEGTLYVDGIDTSDEERLLDIRQSAGMVFQNPDNQIVCTLVDEEVAFGPENIGVPSEEIWERVEKSLKAVGMYEYRNASPNKLSGGQKQRIAIAGIVAMKPKCIVLDEPTAMLDPHGRKDVMKVLHELNRREGVTIILITHYMDEVIDADKVFVMDDGKLVMQGKPREIFSQVDRLKELRLDVPQVTELAYELKKSGLDMPDGILTHEEFRDALKKCMADAGAPKNGGAK